MSPEDERQQKDDTPAFDSFDEEFLRCLPIFYYRLNEESERGSAIIVATLMDDALQQLLRAKLVPSPERNDELFDGAYAPLSSFSAKIDFAYRVGAIGPGTRSSLHLVRKIRNEFAHSSTDITFESRSVHSRIQELFKLNRGLLDVVWEVVAKEEHPQIKQMKGDYRSNQGVDYLVKIMGWRATFEFLSSMIAAKLTALHKVEEPLKSAQERHKTST